METIIAPGQEKKYLRIITIVSVAVPIVVAALLFSPLKLALPIDFVYTLPHINGVINSLTAVFLIVGVILIKRKNIRLHRAFMTSAFVLGSLFLISYVAYHASAESTLYGDINHDGIVSEIEQANLGGMRSVYLVLLLSHIALSIIVLPFVLLAMYYGLTGQFVRHTKITKWSFPIWLYVSVSGVVVYLMISPYYPV